VTVIWSTSAADWIFRTSDLRLTSAAVDLCLMGNRDVSKQVGEPTGRRIDFTGCCTIPMPYRTLYISAYCLQNIMHSAQRHLKYCCVL